LKAVLERLLEKTIYYRKMAEHELEGAIERWEMENTKAKATKQRPEVEALVDDVPVRSA
jgi:hypothetical protein